MKFSWKDEPELMKRLLAAQNSPAHENRDVMTFAGFCESREQLEKHVLSVEAQAAERRGR
jgi:hypothetical protein